MPMTHDAQTLFLDKHHSQELLTRRALAPEWIAVNCRSLTAAQASDLLGYDAKSDGIWLEGTNFQGQFKPDKPWKSRDEKGKPPKYRSGLGEYDAMLPLHPIISNYWDDMQALKLRCYSIDGHPCLILTEGFFKALAGCSHDLPTIALIGVEMGLTPQSADPQNKRYLVPTLERYAKAGFGFIIGFDADCALNANVLAAQRKLGHQLQKFKVPVYSVTGLWKVDDSFDNQDKGMDDYIKNHGADQFRREVMAKAVPWETWEAQFRAAEAEPKHLSQQRLSMTIVNQYRDSIAWHVANKAWYWYEAPVEGKVYPGVWAEVPEEEIGALIVHEAAKTLSDFGHDLVSGTMRLLRYHLRVNRWETVPGYVCLKDCILQLATLETLPHQPGYRFLSALPFRWKDRAIGCDPVQRWLLDVCEGRQEWVELLRAAMNATVTERAGGLQRFMELVGFGGTGKGTIIRLVTALVGKENVAVTDLKQLEKNRFETASLYGKKAVIITDSERYTGDVSVLKALTGEDLLRYEKKGLQQTQGFRYNGMVWIAANEAIQSADYTSGLKRRRCSMLFNRIVPPHKRRDLEAEFAPYLPGLLHWVLCMPESEVGEYVRNTEAKVPSLKGFQAEILIETNPLALWADTNLILAPGEKTYIGNKGMDTSQYLFSNYCAWTETAGYQAVSQARFSRNLLDLLKSQLGIEDVEKKTGNRGVYIVGVSLRLPGMIDYPRLITADEASEGSVKEEVKGLVKAPTQTEQGFSESEGFLLEKNQKTENEKTPPLPLTHETENASLPPEDEVSLKPSLSPNPRGEREEAFTEPSTKPFTSAFTNAEARTERRTDERTDERIDNNISSFLTPLESLRAVQGNVAALGELALSLDEHQLQEALQSFTTEEIAQVKEAANKVWKPGLNRDALYKGNRVEIWEVGQGRDIRVRTHGGTSFFTVKRGDLTPWLGL